MSDPGVGGEVAAEGADHEVLIGLPEFFAGDASTVTANVDGLRHFEAAVMKRQTKERAHGDAVFVAAPSGDSRQRSKAPIGGFGESRAGRSNEGMILSGIPGLRSERL